MTGDAQGRERFVGQEIARLEDPPLLTGRGRFLDDLDPLPGTLVAAVVRSPHPHAYIRSVDLDRARAHPGVAAAIGPDEVREALKPFPLCKAWVPAAVALAGGGGRLRCISM